MDNDTDAFVPGAATTDRNYTQGAHVVWHFTGAPAWADAIVRRLDPAGLDAVRSGLSLGQEMYTPDAISRASFIPNDRPYAGWLFGSAFVAVASERRERTLELTAGVVGPAAGAEEGQAWWHQRWNVRAPRGWRWQLPNDPAFALPYQQR